MTDQPEHQPGVELDIKVAEALGWPGGIRDLRWNPSADDREACKDIEDELLRRGFVIQTTHQPPGSREDTKDTVDIEVRKMRRNVWRKMATAPTYGMALCLTVLALAEAGRCRRRADRWPRREG